MFVVLTSVDVTFSTR